MAYPPTPSMASRSQQFDDEVLQAVEDAERDWGIEMRHIEIGAEDVPPSDPSAWEDSVCLGRAFPADGKLKPRIVLYRLPITTRTPNRQERTALIHHVVRSQLSALTGHPYDDEI